MNAEHNIQIHQKRRAKRLSNPTGWQPQNRRERRFAEKVARMEAVIAHRKTYGLA